MRGIWALPIVAGILLFGTIAASLSLPEADAARSSKPKEIVVVGSKVKEVVKSVKIELCNFVLHSERVSSNESVQANPGGVVKLSNISSNVQTVDVQCSFEDGSRGDMLEGIVLKDIGTTVIHYGDLSRPGGGQ